MAFSSGQRRKGTTRGRLVVKAAKQALGLWFICAAGIYVLVCESGFLLDEDDGYLASFTAFKLSNYHRRALSSTAKGYQYHDMSSRPVAKSIAELQAAGALNNKVRAVGPKIMTQKDMVREKIRKRKEKREKAEVSQLKEGMELTSTFDFSRKNFSSYPVLSSKRVLPDMTTNKGGVIFFLHVPKTGGQTIRQNFGFKWISKLAEQQVMNELQGKESAEELTVDKDLLVTPTLMNKIKFVMANRLDVFLNRAVPKVNKFLSSSNNFGKILMVEVHGMDNYHALELEPYLHAWRQRSKETNVPFFAFTLLREAVSEQVSFFNFYYIHPGDTRFCASSITTSTRCRKREASLSGDYDDDDDDSKLEEDELIELTLRTNAGIDLEDAMLRSIYDNPQCLFLARGERSYGDASHERAWRQNLRGKECEAAYQSLRRSMDWIGRTDTLTSETLPLLTTMMFKKPTIGGSLQRANASPKKSGFIVLSDIQERTRKGLEQASLLDQQLYQHVLRDYQIEQWVNYEAS